MANSNRVTCPGLPHYVAQRGRSGAAYDRRPVFRESADYRVFLHLLEESCKRYNVAIWGYTLLPRGYSLILVPDSAEALHSAIQRLDSEYAHYHNLRHMIRGQVWSGPFQSVAMCWSQVWDAITFVERDPVRNEQLTAAWAHPWSSAAARLGRSVKADWLNFDEWARQFEAPQWQRRLQAADNEEQFGRDLTLALVNGWALGEMLAMPAPLVRKGPQRAEGLRVVKRVAAV